MKIELSDLQWRDVQTALLMAISTTEENYEKCKKHKGVNFEKYPLMKRYLETHDVIAKARGML